MKEASKDLKEFLASASGKNLKIADLYTFTLTNGTILRYTSADFDIIYNENKYSSKNAGISRSDMSWQTGLSVDNVTIEMYPSAKDLVGSVTLVEAFRNGSFDGAWFQLDWACYNEGWTKEPLILEKLFTGSVNVDEVGGAYIKLNIQALTNILNTKFPPAVYQTACSYALYGAGCNADRANFSENSNVRTDSTKKVINCNISQSSGYYQNGVVLFTSGQNLNIRKSIKTHIGGVLTLSTPLQYTPQVGDTFTIYAGCDKTMATCKNKFNNLDNFSGTPFIPNPDSTLT